MQKVNALFDNLKSQNPDLREKVILGEVHTHPYTKEELGRDPWHPSITDIEQAIENLKTGLIPGDKPYLFGIAIRGESKQMKVMFYRIVKKENGDYIPKVVSDWDWK